MAKLTRGNICYNLRESPFFHNVNYGDSDLCFRFSSKFYEEKFINQLSINRTNINNSLTNRFGFETNVDILADIKLYSTIEKRGFLIQTDKDNIECLDDIILNGLTLIIRN